METNQYQVDAHSQYQELYNDITKMSPYFVKTIDSNTAILATTHHQG